jgi:hypothetical protein
MEIFKDLDTFLETKGFYSKLNEMEENEKMKVK